eukprot:m51a1_g12236 hypothetical protein (879) ;mRNA; r:95310-98670
MLDTERVLAIAADRCTTESSGSGHDISHVLRVASNARRIAAAEGADVSVCEWSALLHELFNYPKDDPRSPLSGDVCAAEASKALLAEGCDAATAERVAYCIRVHPFSRGVTPDTLEAKILQDADRLDAIGAVGVARCFSTGAEMHRPMYEPRDPFCEHREPDDKKYTLDHFYKKLLKIPETLHTETARQMARERVSFMKACVLVFAALEVSVARPFNVHDLVGLNRVGTAASDGYSRFVVPISVWDEAANKKTQNLWLGSTTQRGGLASDRSPVWTADGTTVLFLSSREGGNSLWAADPSHPEAPAYRVASFAVPVDNVVVAPSGGWLALTAQVYPGLSMQQTAQRDADRAASRENGGYVFEGLFIRRWDEWWLGKFNHVFIMRIARNSEGKWTQAGEPVDVMPQFQGDCPSRPSGGTEEFAWSPDASEIAFTTQVGDDMAWSTDLNVHVYSVATSTSRCLTCDNKATDTSPAYSPDGSTLAYLAMSTPGYESDTKNLVVYDRRTGARRVVAGQWDRSIDQVLWMPDGRTVVASAASNARQGAFAIDTTTDVVTPLLVDHNNAGLSLVRCVDRTVQTCILFTRSDLTHPADIWATRADGTAYQLTSVNDQRLTGVELTETREWFFEGAGGDTIQAWVHMPYGFKPTGRYPIVLYIHGGPESPWFDSWSYRWNGQTVAAQGYVVVAPNFHGSGSFGSNFTRSILLDWGGKPFEDLMTAVRTFARENKWADASRVGAMGASYGGYMINWINGNTDGEFKCLICHDGLFDTVDKYYATDELFFSEFEFGGTPFEEEALQVYRKWSPSTYAAKFNTPELIFQGGKDFRIPDTNGISTFTLLQRKRVPSKLVYFPSENHWVTDPNNSVMWHNNALDWLNRWLK